MAIDYTNPYAEHIYNEHAEQLEKELREQAPLLKWHVLRMWERKHVVGWHKQHTLDLTAIITINKEKLTVKHSVGRDSHDAGYIKADHVVHSVAREIAYGIVEWSPPDDTQA